MKQVRFRFNENQRDIVTRYNVPYKRFANTFRVPRLAIVNRWSVSTSRVRDTSISHARSDNDHTLCMDNSYFTIHNTNIVHEQLRVISLVVYELLQLCVEYWELQLDNRKEYIIAATFFY